MLKTMTSISAALAGLLLAIAPAAAQTRIDFTGVASGGDFLLPAPGAYNRRYDATGSFVFAATVGNGMYGLADLASFDTALHFSLRAGNPVFGPVYSADFSFALPQLTAFSATIAGGQLTALSWTTAAQAASTLSGPPLFQPAPQSIQFFSGGDHDDLAEGGETNFYGHPGGTKTLVAIGNLDPILAGVAVSAVPEPAAWALLILGLGAVGGAMRRRHGVLARA